MTSLLERLFNGEFSKHMRQAKEDSITDSAAQKVGYILAAHNVQKGGSIQLGDFKLTHGNTADPKAGDNLEVEVDYKGRRVLNYSSYGDHYCTIVSRREMSLDLGWIDQINPIYQAARRMQSGNQNRARYLP